MHLTNSPWIEALTRRSNHDGILDRTKLYLVANMYLTFKQQTSERYDGSNQQNDLSKSCLTRARGRTRS
jgi:hypothetical protein